MSKGPNNQLTDMTPRCSLLFSPATEDATRKTCFDPHVISIRFFAQSGWERLHGYDEGPRKSDSFDVCTDLGGVGVALGNGEAAEAAILAASETAADHGRAPSSCRSRSSAGRSGGSGAGGGGGGGELADGETPPPKMTTSATSATCAASAVTRGFSTSSDSKLLEDEIGEEVRVIMRPRKPPPRPKSEVFLDSRANKRKSKRYSAFGVSFVTPLVQQLKKSGDLY